MDEVGRNGAGAGWEPGVGREDLMRLGAFVMALLRRKVATVTDRGGRFTVDVWEPYDDPAVVAMCSLPPEVAARIAEAAGVEILGGEDVA